MICSLIRITSAIYGSQLKKPYKDYLLTCISGIPSTFLLKYEISFFSDVVRRHLEYAVKQALPKFVSQYILSLILLQLTDHKIAEISHAVNDCGTHNEGPHYAFLDPRIYDAPNMNDVVAQAVGQADTIAVVLAEKGLKREQIYFNVSFSLSSLKISLQLPVLKRWNDYY